RRRHTRFSRDWSSDCALPICLLGYWLWLLKEVVKANIDVAKIVLNPRLPISPTVISVEANRLPVVSQVLFANSITLTPGTVSIRSEERRVGKEERAECAAYSG